MIQAPGRPVEFRPEQHSDFIFSVSRDGLALGALGAVMLIVILAWTYRRRRKRGGDDSAASAT